jgi:gamma-glutamyltranspeptidase/glutathione hydrolase
LNSSILRTQGYRTIGANSANAITLPGAIAAFEKLAEDFSDLGLAEACKSAIYYSENGIPVAPRVAFDWEQSSSILSSNAKKHYLINGKAPRPGEIFKAPLQAQVLKKIAQYGSKGFYSGEVGEDLITSLRNMGGLHTMEDLENVSCEYVEPISAHYNGVDLVELPPNGQGATALLLSKILSNFDYGKLDPLGYDRVHLEAEASKLAYSARNQFIGDKDYMTKVIDTFFDDV